MWCSVLDLRNDLVLLGVIGSSLCGGIFSLLPSPSRVVDEYLIRFEVGVLSGVSGRAMSQGDGLGGDDDGDVESEGA